MKGYNKINKATIKSDLTIWELANVISEVIIEHYGTHNYEVFKNIVNKKLN